MLTVADLCPYWSWPPTAGGQLRVYNLNRVVARHVRVLQFSARPTLGHQRGGWLNWIGSRTCHIADHYLEYQYFHPLILGTSYLLYRLGLHSDMLLSPILKWLSPIHLRQAVRQASVIQVEHPWLFEMALHLTDGKPIIYVAHNVEASLWESLARKRGSLFAKLAGRTRELEREAVQRASVIVAMSRMDLDILVNEYSADLERIYVIPNGVDLNTRRPATPAEKMVARQRLGWDDRPILLFVGSDHYPNKEALGYIRRWQAQLGPELDVQFVVVGTVGRGVQSTEYMRIEGFVEDVTDYFIAADIALNPLVSGSGTSLKGVEYLACGLPTITTMTGIRGLEFVAGRDILLGDLSDFPQLIARLSSDPALQAKLACNGRRAVEQIYGWERLGQCMLEVYEKARQNAGMYNR
jgi:glycosyltransferase involved in cell wall biosynthesis